MTNDAKADADVDALALAYLRFAAALAAMPADSDGSLSANAERDQPAFAFVESVVVSGPSLRAWPVVRAILMHCSDDDLAFHAAGPLEQLVRYHGVEVVDVIEREAASDPRFECALGAIWVEWSALPRPVVERIVRASGGAIFPT
jgi:hypothetical protein